MIESFEEYHYRKSSTSIRTQVLFDASLSLAPAAASPVGNRGCACRRWRALLHAVFSRLVTWAQGEFLNGLVPTSPCTLLHVCTLALHTTAVNVHRVTT